MMLQEVKAQDPQFSQYYASPLYLNPAFTGATGYHRLVLNYRNQWPAAVTNSFETYTFSYDFNWDRFHSGLGIFAIQDRAGTSALTFRNIGGLYSYEAQLTRKLFLRGGIHFSYTTKDVDYSRLLFNDQIYRGGGPSFDASSYFNISYMDIATGGLLYSENAFIGFAAHHLNEPDESFLGGDSRLPMKISLHGGYKFNLPSRYAAKSILLSFNYKQQANFDQFDMGVYYNHEPIVFGVWYRGIPITAFKQDDYLNNDAIAVLVGYAVNDMPLNIGYSYDITVSGLFSKSGGSHEISLIYDFGKGNDRRGGSRSRYNRNPIPCAAF